MNETILFLCMVAIILICIPSVSSKFIFKLVQYLSPNVESTNIKRRIIVSIITIGLLLTFFIIPQPYRIYFIYVVGLFSIVIIILFKKIILILKKFIKRNKNVIINSNSATIYPIINKNEQNQIDNAIKISFSGDLLLLRDMVENAFSNNSYNFDLMFEHVSEYWRRSDLAIGVLEGPIASPNRGYTNSIYSDNVPLLMNFPYNFGKAIKDAGLI